MCGGGGNQAVLAGFHVPSRVVVFDAVTYKVISQGVKRLLLLNVPKRMLCLHVTEKCAMIECVESDCHRSLDHHVNKLVAIYKNFLFRIPLQPKHFLYRN